MTELYPGHDKGLAPRMIDVEAAVTAWRDARQTLFDYANKWPTTKRPDGLFFPPDMFNSLIAAEHRLFEMAKKLPRRTP